MKGIIYYTDGLIEEPIRSWVRKLLLDTGLPIVSTSPSAIDFGENFIVQGKRCYTTMVRQIVVALENSLSDYVFFCEHDVLYHPSHFEFTPPTDDVYYYNLNNWRWDYPQDRLIGYEGLTSLSQMCCNRELALEHFKSRQKRMDEIPEEFGSRDPSRARKWGYEPGTKLKRIGGFSDETSVRWKSRYPNIDIRHKGTFSPPKVTLESFKHLPTGWKESKLDLIEGWNLKEYLWNSA